MQGADFPLQLAIRNTLHFSVGPIHLNLSSAINNSSLTSGEYLLSNGPYLRVHWQIEVGLARLVACLVGLGPVLA